MNQAMPAPGKIHTSRSRIRRALKISAIHHQRREAVSADGGANRGKLKADQDEDQPVQNESQRLPDGPDLDANRRREEGALRRDRNNPHATTASTPEA